MSYDPSNDMAGLPRLFDQYVQATASTFRPDIEKAIDLTQEIESRAARALAYWHRRKNDARTA